MSPRSRARGYTRIRFPRVSGDEPYVGKTKDALTMFSPRERG